MQIGSVLGIASSGLRLEERRLEQSAQNIANVNTEGYESRVVLSRDQPAGGVSPTYSPQGLAPHDDGAPAAPSNTDIAAETVTQISSLRAFQADLAVLRTADTMLGELVKRTV
jgi:flagellar basal-body rod protein FlgC